MNMRDQYALVDRDEIAAKSRDAKTNKRENAITRTRRENSVKGVKRINMKHGGKKYDTQFTNTEENK